jgi:hemerythrin
MNTEKIIWNEKYSVGIGVIDQQHKQLFELIAKIDLAAEEQASIESISLLFAALTDYTVYHFKEEEKYLAVLDKDSFALHKKQHEFFIEKLENLKQQSARIGTVSLGLLYFLKDWLIQHIQIEDQKYAKAI